MQNIVSIITKLCAICRPSWSDIFCILSCLHNWRQVRNIRVVSTLLQRSHALISRFHFFRTWPQTQIFRWLFEGARASLRRSCAHRASALPNVVVKGTFLNTACLRNVLLVRICSRRVLEEKSKYTNVSVVWSKYIFIRKRGKIIKLWNTRWDPIPMLLAGCYINTIDIPVEHA